MKNNTYFAFGLNSLIDTINNNRKILKIFITKERYYDLIKKIQHLFKRWSPAVFIGYNTINFDEEFLRKTFFKLLFEFLSENNGETATGKGLRFPLVMSTSISECE